MEAFKCFQNCKEEQNFSILSVSEWISTTESKPRKLAKRQTSKQAREQAREQESKHGMEYL